MTVLADLRTAFDADHAECEAHALLPSVTPRNTCRYCRRFLWRHPDSKIDGHGSCIVSDAFKRRVHETMRDPRITYPLVAAALGVSIAVVRGWWAEMAARQREAVRKKRGAW